MRPLKRVLLTVAFLMLLLFALTSSVGCWFIMRSFPQIDGSLHVPGLKSKAEVVRDPMGVPHIYANNLDDLFFANGYVHAQDRLWQMEYNRRVGNGTLSDIFGSVTIQQDRYLRTIGLDRSAHADYGVMSDESKHMLQSYASGVNAFIDSHNDSLPIEFDILGLKPAHWEPVDTVAWGKVMALDLGGRYWTDLLRAALIDRFSADKMRELVARYPKSGPFIISPEMKEYNPEVQNEEDHTEDLTEELTELTVGPQALIDIVALNAWQGLVDSGVGSNNWIIGGTRSTTGKPILANDPHLGIRMPSIWYQNGLHCIPKSYECDFDVVGFTFAGVPGVLIGHNARIAWGMTNVGPDVQDLFVEKVNPQNRNQFEFMGKWEDMQIVDEPIKVRGVVSETLRVRITRHGPILTPVLAGVSQEMALQWTALRERGHLFEAIIQIDRADNWDEFRSALQLWDAPSQNFVYADVAGNIGYQMAGNIPIRAKGDGTLPVPGWNGEYEWKGYIPFDELPFVYNPSSDLIATANNAVVPPTYKYLISADWAAPYREQRIIDLLKVKDKLSVEDTKAIQGDVYSIPEVQLQKYVVAIAPQSLLEQRAIEQVKAWDGQFTLENTGGTILEVTYQRLLANMFADRMGDELFAAYRSQADNHRQVVLALLDQPNSDWWDDAKTPQKENRDDTLKNSFAEGVYWLGSQFGDSPSDWHWSRLHTVTFSHPIGSLKPLNLLLNVGPIGIPGGVFTVFASSFNASTPYAVSSGSSMRVIVDLSSWNNSYAIHTTGQSGQPLNRHYSDMVPVWAQFQYAPFFFDDARLNQMREGLLVMLP